MASSPPTKKSPKGTVVVRNFQGRLRLVWSFGGRRYCLSTGFPDGKVNRLAAEAKARQIELDMITGNFNPTLEKYDPRRSLKDKPVELAAIPLLERFILHKQKEVYHRTLEKYRTALEYLRQFLAQDSRRVLDVKSAERLVDYLRPRLAPVTLKERLTIYAAGWRWGVEQGLVTSNPWEGLPGRVKVPPKQMPRPFTQGEVEAILQGFREHPRYCHYSDFVSFLFGTGCRTGEAIGLRWGHLHPDCSGVWFGESISRGVRKATKTNRARSVTLPKSLQVLLLARRPQDPHPDDLVFTAAWGGIINDHNFRDRVWKPVLQLAGVDYRKPYTTRHTLISHALAMGMDPVTLAQLAGHDVETLYQNYAGSVSSRPRLPDMLSGG